ncbi:hypothetical protein SAMN02787142_0739 [Burkholderia sp. WP9]|uniref:hypothetical protein n=1 Tax=Burkholderia sp. WP9 TaxID=1500263 RepID=UPI00089960A1|nr:hypothetical protein [Burkholderia sp. WP9]SEC02562.1 hypothetical protein SAMN02787142_0739 [Burkholderia sp. WP9]
MSRLYALACQRQMQAGVCMPSAARSFVRQAIDAHRGTFAGWKDARRRAYGGVCVRAGVGGVSGRK